MSGQTITNKPEVQYMGILFIKEWWHRKEENDPIEYVALLQSVLNHPQLGQCHDVRTSPILVWPDEKGNFETKNTRYVRVYPSLKKNESN